MAAAIAFTLTDPDDHDELDALAKRVGSEDFAFIAAPDPAGNDGFVLCFDVDQAAAEKVAGSKGKAGAHDYLAALYQYVIDEAEETIALAEEGVTWVDATAANEAGTVPDKLSALLEAQAALEGISRAADQRMVKDATFQVRAAARNLTIANRATERAGSCAAAHRASAEETIANASARRDEALAALEQLG